MPRGPFLTEAERGRIWDLRDQGEPIRLIARRLNRDTGTVRRCLAASGGVRPRPRRRSARELTKSEREEISRGLAVGDSCRLIARRLGRAASSISREVTRNGGRQRYRAEAADESAWWRRLRPKPCKLALRPQLRQKVVQLLKEDWSPQQISNRLKLDYVDQPEMQISHETIYLTLFVQTRGSLRQELSRHLRSQRRFRQAAKARADGRGTIPDLVPISERPAEADDRAVPGHWEGDVLKGKLTDGIGTLVERSSRYVMLFTLPGPGIRAEVVRQRMAETILKLPESLRRSLTWDRGKEMSEHVRFTVETGVQVYFCDPSKPWQRGSNENTNGLLRQYFPKGRSLARVSQAELDRVADLLNGRPRKTLGWRTPAEALEHLCYTVQESSGASTA